MAALQSIFDLLSVILRGLTLIFEAAAVGGIAFVFLILPRSENSALARKTARRIIFWSAISLIVSQVLFVSIDLLILTGSSDLSLMNALGANFVLAGTIFIGAALIAIIMIGSQALSAKIGCVVAAVGMLAASVMTAHAMARLDGRAALAAITALHQLSIFVWVGGLPYLWLALKRISDSEVARQTSLRFSRTAMVCVAAVALTGIALSWAYVGSWSGFYATSYGAMVATKAILFACLLAIGALNYTAIRNSGEWQPSSTLSLRRFLEAEIGIGLTVILAAASLTSQPPAIDVTSDRASAGDVAERMTPAWPSLTTPAFSELAAQSQFAARFEAAQHESSFRPTQPAIQVKRSRSWHGIAWSEYNHHWAGLIVLFVGLLALVSRMKHGSWADHWPLLFLALGVFILLRADPEVWPLGPFGFWRSFQDPEVLQHRVAVLLVAAFAIFEWRVRTHRTNSEAAALVFPTVCALGGVLLVTHSHALSNIKEQLLVELTHLPLAILAVVAGWSRWLEIRLPSTEKIRVALAAIWPTCFILIGLFLLNYREG